MFGLDPLSRPVAIAEILLLLALAAFIGWLLSRLVLTGQMNALRSSIADKEAELDDCRRSKATPPPDAESTPFVADPVRTYVSADPLQPALAHDDTPDLVVEAAEPPAHTDPPPLVSPAPATTPAPIVSAPTAGGSEAAVMSRIASRVGELNFDRIGLATAAEADDLKDIVGIGPFLERKLHSLGIYTFRQVANFTKEDIDKVNEIIEFFPGRIERDNWVDQSKAFYERKYRN